MSPAAPPVVAAWSDSLALMASTTAASPASAAAAHHHHPLREGEGAIPKGIKWSPDGMLLAAGTSRGLHVFDVPTNTWQAVDGVTDGGALQSRGGSIRQPALLYDYAWHPACRSWERSAGCALVATTCKDQPVSLWDCGGADTATDKVTAATAQYVGINHLDELAAVLSLAFSPDGGTLYGGCDRAIQVFDVARPGRCTTAWPTARSRHAAGGQKGLVSALAAPSPHALVAGTYTGSLAMYDTRTGRPAVAFGSSSDSSGGGGGGGGSSSGHRRPRGWVSQPGITHLVATPDGGGGGGGGVLVYVGRRRGDGIQGWDARMPSAPRHVYPRRAATNQRLQFDVVGATLASPVTPGDDGCQVVVYDIVAGTRVGSLGGFPDAVNAISLHPSGGAAAVAVGCRQPLRLGADDSSSSDSGGSDGDDRPAPAQRPRIAAASTTADTTTGSPAAYTPVHVPPAATRCGWAVLRCNTAPPACAP